MLKIYSGYKESAYNELKESIIIEHTLKYCDVDAIKLIVNKYGVDECKKVWIKTLIPDKRMEKLNFFLAKFFFNISSDDAVIRNFITCNSKTRLDRINEILNR
jgi:hypothetical protein